MLTGDVPFHGENQVAVAMKHVRDELPDVQARRPEISSALAAVVDHATAQGPRASATRPPHGLIADLEDALAIETARSGQTTGEATTVLAARCPGRQRRVPLRVAHPWRWLAGIAIVALLAIDAAASRCCAAAPSAAPGRRARKAPPRR